MRGSTGKGPLAARLPYHALDFDKYGTRYLGAFAYRFNRRFDLAKIPLRLLATAASMGPRPRPWLRLAEKSS